ncbi:bifunctional diguanylate cyclase/phosphodiesterase [Bacillus sp. FJAT-22090]|uniref:sensor domain-containing protein n=1 Tax=Bacillus sp. FJAT-22090 TaxID=1581038 RepID=UPI001642A4C0|nr:bifunctional diguanylate cyclase/phosphodiesterase [Bacillus sp. FJAT-22090]
MMEIYFNDSPTLHSKFNKSDFIRFIENFPEPICILTLKEGQYPDRFIYANGAAVKLTGMNMEDICSYSWEDMFEVPSDSDFEALEKEQLSKTHKADSTPLKRNLEGKVLKVTGHAIELENEERYLILTIIDITEHQDTRNKLKKSKKEYESLFYYNPNLVFAINPEGNLTNFNAAGLKILKYSFEEIIGMSFQKLIVPKDLQLAKDNFYEVLKGNTAEFQISVLNSEGTVLNIDITAVPTILDGEVMEVIGIARDITEQIRMEHLLKESEQRYRALFDHNIDPVITFDLKGRFLVVNEATEKILGVPAEELIGNPFLPFIDKHKQEETIANFQKVHSGHPHQYETSLHNQNGEQVLLHITVIPIFTDRKLSAVHCIGKDITNMKRNEEKANFMAYHDMLTGLGNQRLFQEDLRRIIETQTSEKLNSAILLVDLDRFKFINDYLGHEMGDALLKQVSERLVKITGLDGKVYRYAGDEFTIIMQNIDESKVLLKVKTLVSEIGEPFDVDGFETILTASIGISLFPKHATDIKGLMRASDHAMYFAKRQGRNNYQIYNTQIEGLSKNDLRMETLLHKALNKQEFVLHYQPQYDAITQKVSGIEALLRWNSKDLGMVSPVDFIPLAEETGMIVPIGEWVIREACSQNKEWQRQGLPPVPISVNLSLRQFYQTDLVEKIELILKETKLNPKYLELEITETIAMQPDIAIRVLNELKSIGVLIAMDDFGTGYSSLNYLRRFPIDHLKIDKAFVQGIQQDEEDRSIIATIIALGHNLGMPVIAEGVETEEQANLLKNYNCDMFQGYLFSRPLPAEMIPGKFK